MNIFLVVFFSYVTQAFAQKVICTFNVQNYEGGGDGKAVIPYTDFSFDISYTDNNRGYTVFNFGKQFEGKGGRKYEVIFSSAQPSTPGDASKPAQHYAIKIATVDARESGSGNATVESFKNYEMKASFSTLNKIFVQIFCR